MDLKFMDLAFKMAEKAFKINEIPVGAVIVKDGKVVSKAYNIKEKKCCVIKHAEILALEKASKKIKNWRLEGCDMYVTLEPCPMCASAIKQARISNVYCAVKNNDENNIKIINKIFEKDRINPNVNFINNLAVEKGKKILQNFFINKRKK